MSRSSTRKAAPANPAPDTPAAAPVAATPDPAKGTPQVAPETTGAAVAAAAPVDPTLKTRAAKGLVLRVSGPAKGRWRAGRHFGPDAVDIPVADLSEDEIARLKADPELIVVVVAET